VGGRDGAGVCPAAAALSCTTAAQASAQAINPDEPGGLLLSVLAVLAWFWWTACKNAKSPSRGASGLRTRRSAVPRWQLALRKLKLRRDDMQRARFYANSRSNTPLRRRPPGRLGLAAGRPVVDVTLVEQTVLPFRS